MLDPREVHVLNDGGDRSSTENSIEPVELSKSLHRCILRLKGKYLSEDGSKVDYAKLRQDSRFHDFEEETHFLLLVDLDPLGDKERKAFFINMYNTLTTHALAATVTQERSVLEVDKLWQKYAYRIGKYLFSLDDIEHGVLRGNKLHPTYKDYFFKENDPRRTFVEAVPDPRIHFALNCGAKSCPPIRLFSPDNIDTALDLATRAFCQGDVIIDAERKVVRMTKILMWYGTDFGEDEKSILIWLSNYMSEEQAAALEVVIDDSPTIEFSDYNWGIL